MATGIGLRPFWPLLCGISRRIVSKPRTDTLETCINASHSLDMLGYYLLQVVWYVLPIFLCDVGNVLRNFGNELRSALVGPAVAWVQVIITAIDQYCPERWKNPTSVWRHGDGLKASENQQGSQLRQPEHLPNLHMVHNSISATQKNNNPSFCKLIQAIVYIFQHGDDFWHYRNQLFLFEKCIPTSAGHHRTQQQQCI